MLLDRFFTGTLLGDVFWGDGSLNIVKNAFKFGPFFIKPHEESISRTSKSLG